ncbi:MAG: putative DNA binding domain-containing protein [Prevotella sp.]|nr:putative DNA binding domain-containing protein [Prevotella sp.]
MNVEELRKLISDIESDSVERTISTTNTDKFGQAICAFANDLPGHNTSGYLIIGVEDDGKVKGIHVTDDLLLNLAAIRTDGNIQPQPSMTVQKVAMEEGDVVVVKVEPSLFPPVKYKGRTWVRIGPRKSVANENDEHILSEKRRSGLVSFDSSPCTGATINDMDLQLFKYYYLPKAMPEDVLEDDKRDVRVKLSSFGFFDIFHDCPTNAGLLFFAKNLRRFIPGAYVQYVRFAGVDRASDIMNEHEFKENLCTVLPELDTFIKTTIANRRPIPVSAAREENVVDYPDWATRELLMNAICHRDYSTNGPIQFYQYENRIEITNHGGLYGRANEANFPNVNDYRNVIVAEAMKVLGFVNRHSRGVLKVQKDLLANENGEAVYNFEYLATVSVRENKSTRAERLIKEAAENGFTIKNGHGVVGMCMNNTKNGQINILKCLKTEGKNADKSKNAQKYVEKSENGHTATVSNLQYDIVRKVYEAIRLNPKVKYSDLQDNLGISESSVKRAISHLKRQGYINPEHSKANGAWQILINEE